MRTIIYYSDCVNETVRGGNYQGNYCTFINAQEKLLVGLQRNEPQCLSGVCN